jgi:hypothetical protein
MASGQQFFQHVPTAGSGGGPRRFASADRLRAAWHDLPRDWRDPFREGADDAGDITDAPRGSMGTQAEGGAEHR